MVEPRSLDCSAGAAQADSQLRPQRRLEGAASADFGRCYGLPLRTHIAEYWCLGGVAAWLTSARSVASPTALGQWSDFEFGPITLTVDDDNGATTAYTGTISTTTMTLISNSGAIHFKPAAADV